MTGKREQGFVYLGLMIIVVIMGVMLAAAGELWSLQAQREKEKELLFIGNQFRNALNLYYKHSPGFPMSLDDLLKDPRQPSVQRYLRKIYPDPITGKSEWGLVKGPNGEIFGVHSLSDAEPVKKSNFSLADSQFEGKAKYSEWVFMISLRQMMLPKTASKVSP